MSDCSVPSKRSHLSTLDSATAVTPVPTKRHRSLVVDDATAKDSMALPHAAQPGVIMHNYNETAEEVLLTSIEHLYAHYKTSNADACLHDVKRKLEDMKGGIEKTNGRLMKVMHNPHLCILLSGNLLQLGPHICRRREFSITWLANSMHVCLGLYTLILQSKCNMLRRLSSTEPFPSFAEVEILLDKADNGDDDARKKISTLRETFEGYDVNMHSGLELWADLMEQLDEHAREAFEVDKIAISSLTSLYIEQLRMYRHNVIKTLKAAWFKDDARPKDNDIALHLDRVIARVAIHLSPDTHAPEPMLSGFFMDYVWERLLMLEDGIVEICRWFEPLLDYWPFLRSKSYIMNDLTHVMVNNIVNDCRIEDHNAALKVADLIWTHRDPLVGRLQNLMKSFKDDDEWNQKVMKKEPFRANKQTFEKSFEKLPNEEKIATKKLFEMLNKNRLEKNRDMAKWPSTIPGVMALHVTSWDWLFLNVKMNNIKRDIMPLVRAITLERLVVKKYRQNILNDPAIGALRRSLEQILSACAKKRYIADANLRVRWIRRWTWWDGIELTDDTLNADGMVAKMNADTVRKQQQQGERLTLEENDRRAIMGVVALVSGLPCAKATLDEHSLLSDDVVSSLKQLVHALELNSARLRMRQLSGIKDEHFTTSDAVDLRIPIPEGEKDKNTY